MSCRRWRWRYRAPAGAEGVFGAQRDVEGRLAMAKVLRCGDLMPGCNAVIEGKDEAEVMAKKAEHAKTPHKMISLPPDIAAKGQGGH